MPKYTSVRNPARDLRHRSQPRSAQVSGPRRNHRPQVSRILEVLGPGSVQRRATRAPQVVSESRKDLASCHCAIPPDAPTSSLVISSLTRTIPVSPRNVTCTKNLSLVSTKQASDVEPSG